MSTAAQAKSGTLVAAAPAISVKFHQYFKNLIVVNRSNPATDSFPTYTIWVRSDGEDATVGGDNCFPVLPGQSLSFGNGILSQEPVVRVISGTQVSIIATGASPYTVWASR